MSTDAKQGKKKKKNRDYRVKVKDVADWTEKLNFGGLIVAEIYSEVFGPCDAMLPTIQKFMKTEGPAVEKIISFLQLNTTVLDADIKTMIEEEKKKEAERAMLAQRQAALSGGKPAEEKKAPAADEKKASDEKGADAGGADSKEAAGEEKQKEAAETKEEGGSFTIPLIEKYKAITPRPLWLFIKNKEVINVLDFPSPPQMIMCIKNSMEGRKNTGLGGGLAQKLAEKRAKRAAEEKLAKIRNVSVDTLSLLDSDTSAAVIKAFENNATFDAFARATTEDIKKRDAEDATLLKQGIALAIEKKVIEEAKDASAANPIDVTGKSPEQVADEIIGKLGDAVQTGCVVTLEGLSGTGKGTTVSALKSKLSKSVTWSNGDIFRSITLLANQFAEEEKAEFDDALKPENLAAFVARLSVEKSDSGAWDVAIKSKDGSTVDNMVSKINKTLLKSKDVSAKVPNVASVTQGEVINFTKEALAKMTEGGATVLVEGREQTLNYIQTEFRFELVFKDPEEIGRRRAAQIIAAESIEACVAEKESAGPAGPKTYPIMLKTLETLAAKAQSAPAAEEKAPPAEEKAPPAEEKKE